MHEALTQTQPSEEYDPPAVLPEEDIYAHVPDHLEVLETPEEISVPQEVGHAAIEGYNESLRRAALNQVTQAVELRLTDALTETRLWGMPHRDVPAEEFRPRFGDSVRRMNLYDPQTGGLAILEGQLGEKSGAYRLIGAGPSEITQPRSRFSRKPAEVTAAVLHDGLDIQVNARNGEATGYFPQDADEILPIASAITRAAELDFATFTGAYRLKTGQLEGRAHADERAAVEAGLARAVAERQQHPDAQILHKS